MLKNLEKALACRNGSTTTIEQQYFSRIIKRKRLMDQRTLDEVASGICSVSYLSKIENCSVNVDETYFKALFDKLDLCYEESLNLKNDGALKRALIEFFHNAPHRIKEIADSIGPDELFRETEKEIIMLIYNVFQKNYEDCESAIRKLDDIKNSLLDDELEALIIGTTLYLHKTCRNKEAREYIKILLGLNSNDTLIKMVIQDLATSIYYACGDEISAYKSSTYVITPNVGLAPSEKTLVNQVIKIAIESPNMEIEDINRLSTVKINLFDANTSEEYYFYYALSLCKKEKYSLAYDILKKSSLSSRIMALMSVIASYTANKKVKAHVLEILALYTFGSKDEIYEGFTKYTLMKSQNSSTLELFNYLKDEVLKKFEYAYDSWLYSYVCKELQEIGYQAGKYKETLKICTSKFNI